MASLLTPTYITIEDANGLPISGAQIFTYAAGTTTPKAAYTDQGATTQLPNPIIADSAGRFTAWIVGSYKIVVTDALGTVIRTTDNVTSFATAAASASSYFQSFSGTGAQTTFTLSQAMGTDPNALMIFVNSATSVTNTPFFQSLTAAAAQTVYTVSQDLGSNANAIMVYSNTTTKGYEILRPTTDYTISGTTLTLTTAPTVTGAAAVLVFDNPILNDTSKGVGYQVQNPGSYTINGTTLTFSTAPATGTNNVLVFAPSSLVGAASQSADTASAAATAAGNSAAAAANSATSFIGTSTTSVLIATGAQSFTTQLAKNFQTGEFVTVSSNAIPTNYMYGQVSSYNSGTGALVVNVTVTSGSGTYSDWNIALSGIQGNSGGPVANGTYGQVVVTGGGLTWTVQTATTAQPGVTTLASTAVTQTGSSTTTAITPAGLKASQGYTNLFESTEITYVAGNAAYSAAHGLGVVPKQSNAYLRCKITEGGWAVGDEIPINFTDNNTTFSTTHGSNATTCYMGQGGPVRVTNRGGTSVTVLTAANWRVFFRAWG